MDANQTQGGHIMASRAKLVDAAKNLNEVLALDPAIDIKGTASQLSDQIKEAASLLEEKDTVEDGTQEVIDELTGAEAEDEPAAEEEEGEVKTAPKPKAETKPAKPAAKPAAAAGKIARGTAPAAAATPKKSAPPGGFRYEGSVAQKMDQALMKGGNLEKLAETLDVKKGVLRAHANFRAKSGKYELEEKDHGHIKLTAAE
jgi:hypothetical protein